MVGFVYGCSLGRLNMRLNGWMVMVVKYEIVWLAGYGG